jgi:hypothetical protein
MYFVREEDTLSKIWDVLGQPPGYIATYRQEAAKLDGEYLDSLHGALETLFSHCQCLPNSKREGQATIWEVKKGEVILLGNPLYYKLDSVGDGGQRRKTRRAPTHSGTVSIQRGLLQLTGLSKSQASTTLRFANTLKRAAKRKKPARTRNRRMPPPARKKNQAESHEDESSGSEPSGGLESSRRINEPSTDDVKGGSEEDEENSCGESESTDVSLDYSEESF